MYERSQQLVIGHSAPTSYNLFSEIVPAITNMAAPGDFGPAGTFLREGGAVDVGDLLWQKQLDMEKRMFEKYGKVCLLRALFVARI